MNAPQRLKLLVFLTIGVGVACYCIADADWALALLAIPAWAMAWPVSLGPLGKPLPRGVVLLVILAALAYSALRVINDAHDLVIAVSRLLLWLQIAKLYDRWTIRDRGVLMVMSVFLVIGSLLTSNSMWLGASLILYAPLMVWTTLTHELTSLRDQHATRGAPAKRALSSRRSRVDLVRVATVMGVFAFMTSVVVFILVPRGIGEGFLGDWGAPEGMQVSGFNDTVTLGSAGFISESRTPVMDVVLTDASGRNIGSEDRPLLLRGAVLDVYRDGRWSRSIDSERRDLAYALAPGGTAAFENSTQGAPVYTLDVTLRRRPNDYLFTMLRPYAISVERGGRIDIGQRDMQIRTAGGGAALRYTVRVQLEDENSPPARVEHIFQEGPVHDLAVSILEAADMPLTPEERSPADTERAARTLVDHLQRNFVYTTQMTAPDAGEDPIEMFLFRTQEGHCEYFASALSAMCLSVGIDARVITGYMASEFDESSGAYLVRESNAHAWVEVQLERGRWISLDASPPDDLAIAHEPPQGFAALVRGVMDGVSRWWINSVVAFNESRRREMVGEDPLRIERTAQNVLRDALLPERIGGAPIILIALLRGIIAFAATAAFGFALIQIVTLIGVWRARRRKRAAELQGDPAALERMEQRGFYFDAMRILKRAGFARPIWRPAKEHAASLRRVDASMGEALMTVADLYYASRFGRRLLTPQELAQAEASVSRIRDRVDAIRAARQAR